MKKLLSAALCAVLALGLAVAADPVVKSGPRIPPRADTPWQKTHSCRNRMAPCVTDFGSF